MPAISPKFTHDCDFCRFIGQTVSEGIFYDLYICFGMGDQPVSYVARFSDNEPDYSSARADYPDDILPAHHRMTRALYAAQG